MKALCFGSLNIDYTYKVDHFVLGGETQSSLGLQVFTGGKGLNQSVALARAGAETYHAGAIGQDGMFLLEMLQSAGVHTEYTDVREDVRSGNAIIQNDKNGDNCILLYGGANQAITKEQVDRVLANFAEGDYLILQNEINELAYIMEKANAIGMKIVLNPSPMNEKILALPLDAVSIFMLNEVEASQILGISSDESWEVLANKLTERFPGAVVILTLGSDGSVCAADGELIRQEAIRVKAVDTTAAGDTFTGFFIGSLIKGFSYKDAMENATKASSVTVTRPGAAPSIPTWEELGL